MNDSASEKNANDHPRARGHPAPSLKQLAKYLRLNPGTVSVVLNNVPGRSIPQVTRDWIKVAAREMNYQPNQLARSLGSRRTLPIGILVPELVSEYHAQVMSDIGDQLIQAGYLYFTAHHRHKRNLIEDYTRTLAGRGAPGTAWISTILLGGYKSALRACITIYRTEPQHIEMFLAVLSKVRDKLSAQNAN